MSRPARGGGALCPGAGYRPLTLDVSTLHYPPVSEDRRIRHLRSGRVDELSIGGAASAEPRLENYVVAGLVDFDDVS